MTEHRVGTREEWLAARKELLAQEKDLTRRSDELARKRRELPWVAVDDGRSQLLVYHFMFGPSVEGWPEAGCRAGAAAAASPHLWPSSFRNPESAWNEKRPSP